MDDYVQPKVTIVIVNWNRCNDLLRLLDSLKVLEYDNYDLVVVDNASTDDSVERIEKISQKIDLLVNSENLGGTGGFNSGMRFALDRFDCKYIWLLDNDATVSPQALKELVSTMEDDPSVGIAGSRILNAKDPRYVVETGANYDWAAGTVRPVHRNVLKESLGDSTPVDVDYVAVCSALARTAALAQVGLMDERYFLFWDDMDWGLAFRDAGYRVVAVPGSEVFHPAFTEYRSVVVDCFYGVRNQLLTFSKYKHYDKSLVGMFQMLRRSAKGALLMLLSGRPGGRLVLSGFIDYLRGRWGKISRVFPPAYAFEKQNDVAISSADAVLVIPMGDSYDTSLLVRHLESLGVKKIDILIAEDRIELFRGIESCDLLTFNYADKNVTWNTLRQIAGILRKKYDCVITTNGEKVSPFSFAVRKTACFDSKSARIVETREGLAQAWKIGVASLLGEVLGAVMFILAWIRSFALVKER
jgi:hypothetical protein